MCYFISIAIPERNEATFEAWRRRGYFLERQNNGSLLGAAEGLQFVDVDERALFM